MLRLLRLINYRQLRANKGRAALVVGGAATGVTLIVAIQIINASILTNIRRTIDVVAGPAELAVTLGIGEVGFPESTLDIVRRDRDVLAAAPLVRGTISPADTPAETLDLFGADLLAEDQLGRFEITLAGDRRKAIRALDDPRSILFTVGFAQRRHLAVGDHVALSTPRGVETFTVQGLLATKGIAAALGDRLAVMDLPAAQRVLMKDGLVDQIDIVIRPDGEIGTIQSRLQQALPALTVSRPAQRGEQYERIVGSFQAMLTGLSSLCLVAAVFIIYNTTATAVVQRALTLAVLRVAGAEGAQLFRLLVIEAGVLGALGAALGVPIGMALAWLLSGSVADSMGVIFQVRFPVQRLAVDVRELVLIGGLGTATTVLASSLAARGVVRMEPLEAIRRDRQISHAAVSTGRLVLWWLALVGMSAAALVVEVREQSILFGNLGATLWNGSVLVIAIPVVVWTANALSKLLPHLFGPEGQLAASALFRSPMRTGITTAAVALVLTIGITVAAISLSHRRMVARYFDGGFLSSDLMVSAVATTGGWLETPIPEMVTGEIAEVPGVLAAESIILPGQTFRGLRVAVGGGSDGFFDPGRYPAGWYVEGDPISAGRAIQAGEGANISTSLSDRFALHVGDRIELDSPTGLVTVPVVGVVPDYMSDRGSIILSRRVLVDRWHDHAVNRVHVFVGPRTDVEKIRADVAARLADRYRLKILSLGESMRYHDEYIRRAFALIDAIQLLVAIVTIAGIFDLLTASIVERRRELALWRVIGADQGAVRRSVLIESATIGLLGAGLGVAVGVVTAWIWVGINFRYLLGYYLEFHFPIAATVQYVGLVFAMTLLAGGLSALHATRQSVLDGIRKD